MKDPTCGWPCRAEALGGDAPSTQGCPNGLGVGSSKFSANPRHDSVCRKSHGHINTQAAVASTITHRSPSTSKSGILSST